MNLNVRSKAVLFFSAFMFAFAHQAQAQCNHGGSGGSQGRMQTFARQGTLSAGISQPQLSSISGGFPTQPGNLLATLQQQQLVSLLALQRLQQGQQFMAPQQTQNAILAAHPGQTGSSDFASKRRQRRKSSNSTANTDAPSVVLKDSGTEEDIAARRLWMSKDLAEHAERDLGRGERKSAARLRERAGERLLYIVENYARTSSAEEAKSLLQRLTP
jgi:hypothetical protein